MNRLATLGFALIFLSSQIAFPQAAGTDQSSFFKRLGVSDKTSVTDRINACSNALQAARNTKVPLDLYTGLGIVAGSGTVALILGNVTKKQSAKVAEAI